MPTRIQVTIALATARPPKTVRGCRTLLLPSRTHSTHCWPTAAERRQSGQAGLPHRTQDTYVSRPGCRKQVGAAVSCWVPWPGGTAMALSRGSRIVAAIDRDRLEDDILDRPVVASRHRLADLIDDLAAADDLAEDSVLPVQPRSRDGGDEKLRAVRAGTRVGHGKQVRPVEGEIRVKLVSELVTGAAGSRTERVSALNHEIGNHPVKDRPVIELAAGLPGARVGPGTGSLGEADEISHGLRRLIGKEPDGDRSMVRPQRCSDRVRHEKNPRTTGGVRRPPRDMAAPGGFTRARDAEASPGRRVDCAL